MAIEPIRNLVKIVDLGGPTARVVIDEYYDTNNKLWRHARLVVMTPSVTFDGMTTPAASVDVSLNPEATESLIAALRATS